MRWNCDLEIRFGDALPVLLLPRPHVTPSQAFTHDPSDFAMRLCDATLRCDVATRLCDATWRFVAMRLRDATSRRDFAIRWDVTLRRDFAIRGGCATNPCGRASTVSVLVLSRAQYSFYA